jgi:hypothetical protein
MLRLSSFWCLSVFLFIGQAFAVVSVVVDIRQTGPVNSTTSEVITRVGKNVDATYNATASYNGNPTLHAEEKVTGTEWKYTVSPVTDVTISPTSGNGNSASITAKSAEAETYGIAVTFEVKFTITKYKTDGTVDSTRTEEYTGSGSATLTVTAGKFKVTLVPSDNCKETATNKRSTSRFGLGETGTIEVEPLDPNDALSDINISADPVTICEASPYSFTIKQIPGSATITVTAKVGGSTIADKETYGVSAIAPTGMTAVLKRNENNATMVGSGMFIRVHFEPKDVSFSNSILGEGTS